MTELNSLPSIKETSKKRLGQGHGSGKGTTAGRGTKGQHARASTIHKTTGAGTLAWVRRMPLFRGKYRNKPVSPRLLPINLKNLAVLKEGTVVDMKALITHKIIREDIGPYKGIKILGDGEIKVALTIKVPISNRAKVKIEKAGGKVENK